jgi:hypothetical protein
MENISTIITKVVRRYRRVATKLNMPRLVVRRMMKRSSTTVMWAMFLSVDRKA